MPLFKDPSVGVVFSRRLNMDGSGSISVHDGPPPWRGYVLAHLVRYNFICTSTAVFRRDCLKSTGLFDVRLSQGEDLDLWLRFAAAGYKFDYVDRSLAIHRVRGQASLSESLERRYHENRLMLERFFADPRHLTCTTHALRRSAWGYLRAKRGYRLFESGSTWKALSHAVTALTLTPGNRLAWGVVAKCLLGRALVDRLKSLFPGSC